MIKLWSEDHQQGIADNGIPALIAGVHGQHIML